MNFQLEFPLARNTDPTTSHAAAEAIRPKAGTQLHKLLTAYASYPDGLTDEEAGEIAGIRNVLNKRTTWQSVQDYGQWYGGFVNG